MRYLKIMFIVSCFVSLLSCSKEDNKTYAELIIGKWDIVNQIYTDNSSGQSDTLTFDALSTIDFASNGAVVIRIDDDENGSIESSEIQTSTYLLENSKLTFGSEDSVIYTIKTLTNLNFSFQTDMDGYEVTVNLKK